MPLWPERVRISRPCPCAPLAPRGWKCLILASRCGFGALPSQLGAEGCAPGSRPSPPHRRFPHRLPERRDGWRSARPALPLRALPAEFEVATGRV